MHFASLTTEQLGLATAIVLIAYLVRGIAGFGSGLIAIPLLALLLPLSLVVPMIGLVDYIASLAHGVHHRQQIRWREIFPLLPFTLIGVTSALYLFHTVDAALLKRLLGAFVMLYGLYSLFGRDPHGGGSRGWAVPAGTLGGLVGTLFGTGGPFYVIYLHWRGLDKPAFRATIAIVFLLDGASRIVGYTLTGFYTREALVLMAACLPLMAIAMRVGGRIHLNLSPAAFRRLIGSLLVGAGAALLLR